MGDVEVAMICYDTEWEVLRYLHSQDICSWSQKLQHFAEKVSCTCMVSLLIYMGINLKNFFGWNVFLLLKYNYLSSLRAKIPLKNENKEVLLSCSVALYNK